MSPVTRRIYWNTHCVRCNNDDRNILPWNSTVRFNFDITYLLNHSRDPFPQYPEKHDDILGYISNIGNILFTLQFPVKEKLCIRKNTLRKCMKSSTTTTNATKMSWLHDVCDHVYSPIIIQNILGRELSFRNIWASSRENLSSGVCEQHRRLPACASAQSDQRLCYSLFGMYHI